MQSRVVRPEKGGPVYVREMASLMGLGITDLRRRYEEVFGKKPQCSFLRTLRDAIAHEVARREHVGQAVVPCVARPQPSRAAELSAPRSGRDPRLPRAGTVLVREFGGECHEVTVGADCFIHRGARHPSLSSVARAITGTNWNGFRFFGLVAERHAANGEG